MQSTGKTRGVRLSYLMAEELGLKQVFILKAFNSSLFV